MRRARHTDLLLCRHSGPRLKAACQHVELIDEVMYDFPDLIFVTRHGCEPWTDARREADAEVAGSALLDECLRAQVLPARTSSITPTAAGAEKIIYAGYFPMGLSLERIMTEMPTSVSRTRYGRSSSAQCPQGSRARIGPQPVEYPHDPIRGVK